MALTRRQCTYAHAILFFPSSPPSSSLLLPPPPPSSSSSSSSSRPSSSSSPPSSSSSRPSERSPSSSPPSSSSSRPRKGSYGELRLGLLLLSIQVQAGRGTTVFSSLVQPPFPPSTPRRRPPQWRILTSSMRPAAAVSTTAWRGHLGSPRQLHEVAEVAGGNGLLFGQQKAAPPMEGREVMVGEGGGGGQGEGEVVGDGASDGEGNRFGASSGREAASPAAWEGGRRLR